MYLGPTMLPGMSWSYSIFKNKNSVHNNYSYLIDEFERIGEHNVMLVGTYIYIRRNRTFITSNTNKKGYQPEYVYFLN